MGRPPMGMKEYKVQLDPKAVGEVDARVGTYRRSLFIREAVAEKLEREKGLDTPHGTRRENGE